MAGVEEVRNGIAAANEKAIEGITALQQAEICFKEAEQSLATATHGTSQDEILRAHGGIREVYEQIPYLQNTVKASVAAAETYLGHV